MRIGQPRVVVAAIPALLALQLARILSFFHGKDIAVLAHGLTKEDKVPDAEIERAIRRKAALERDPRAHIYEEDDDGEEEDH